jgi:dTDP-4-dehydrorhamnose reductase
MRIWVAGAAGMLGKEVAQQLSIKNIDFIGTDRTQVDITQKKAIESFVSEQKITHIINCAAYTKVDQAESDRKNAYLVNATGAKNLSELPVAVIHFSTDYVFDGCSNTPYSEGDRTNPLNVYGASKQEGEKELLNACVIRTSWLFGQYGKNFVHTMIKLMLERETLSIVCDQIGRPTCAKDLAEFAIHMLNQKGLFHFANREETSWYSFAKAIYQSGLSLGFPFKVKEIKPIPTKEYPTTAIRPPYSVLSTEKIEQQFQIYPRPWHTALIEVLNAQKKS